MMTLAFLFVSSTLLVIIAAIPSFSNLPFPPTIQRNPSISPAQNLTLTSPPTNLTSPNPDAIKCYSPRRDSVDLVRCASIFDYIAASDNYHITFRYDKPTLIGGSDQCAIWLHPSDQHGTYLADDLLLASAGWILAACSRMGSGGEKLVGREGNLIQIRAPGSADRLTEERSVDKDRRDSVNGHRLP